MSELSAALKDVLEKRGVLSQVRARLRSEVYKSLDDQNTPKPQLCRENLLLNELIRDYLVYNQYNYTQSVLTAESGMPKEPLDRDFLARELDLRRADGQDGNSLPLLYSLLNCFLHKSEAELGAESKPHMCEPSTAAPVKKAAGETGAKCTFEAPTYHNTC